jgi:DNA primase
MPGIDFAQVRVRISLLDVLALLDFHPLRCAGNRLRGPCPFACGLSGRSFVAYLDTDRYYCFSCHRSGNSLDLWAAARHLTIYEATHDLCRRLRIEAPLIHHW